MKSHSSAKENTYFLSFKINCNWKKHSSITGLSLRLIVLRWGRGAADGVGGTETRGIVPGVFPLWSGLLGRLLHDRNQLQPRGALLHGPREGRCASVHLKAQRNVKVRFIKFDSYMDYSDCTLPRLLSWFSGYKDAGLCEGRGVQRKDDGGAFFK